MFYITWNSHIKENCHSTEGTAGCSIPLGVRMDRWLRLWMFVFICVISKYVPGKKKKKKVVDPSETHLHMKNISWKTCTLLRGNPLLQTWRRPPRGNKTLFHFQFCFTICRRHLVCCQPMRATWQLKFHLTHSSTQTSFWETCVLTFECVYTRFKTQGRI